MKSILIVDDEPIIVQGLGNVVSDMDNELQVWKANTAKEALGIMERNRIDILITDIKMPGMTGLELAEIVSRQWKHCKIIFLSGYNDQEYLQFAVRQGAFDYLVKPADNDVIVQLINRAVLEIDQEMDNKVVMERAKIQYRDALSLLRKEFFVKLIEGRNEGSPHLQDQFDVMQLSLTEDESLLLIMGRIDRWPTHLSSNDRTLLTYAVENIVENYFDQECHIYSIRHDPYIVWIIQAKSPDEDMPYGPKLGLHGYVHEMLEKVQQAVRNVLQLSLSLVLSKPDVMWHKIRNEYEAMYDVLQRGIGLDEEIIIDDLSAQLEWTPEINNETAILLRYVDQLKAKLENNEIIAFSEQLKGLFEMVRKSVFVSYTRQMELFSTISAMLLSFINRRKLTVVLDKQTDFNGLGNYQAHANWDDLLFYYQNIAQSIHEQMELERLDMKMQIVEEIDGYVHANLDGDLSLHHLAKRVHLSPHYLSRVYHATSGHSLADRIANVKIARAKEMLASGDIKIQVVAAALGFDNNLSYFSKFFKKRVGVTPVEYKEATRKMNI